MNARQDVLVRLHLVLLHAAQEALRLLHVADLRAARHQRRVRVLAHHVVPTAQLRVEVHRDAQLVVVLQMRRLRDPAEQRVGAHGARRQRALHEVVVEQLQVVLGGRHGVARGHQRGDGVLVGRHAVLLHVLAHAERLQRECLAGVVVDDDVEDVAVQVNAVHDHLLQPNPPPRRERPPPGTSG